MAGTSRRRRRGEGNLRRKLASAAAEWVERALWALGVVCLGYVAWLSLEARQFQRDQRVSFEAARRAKVEVAETAEAAPVTLDRGALEEAAAPEPAWRRVAGASRARSAIAFLEVPRLGISAPVLSGDDPETLDVAIGHLPDTPAPWEGGNSAFAAHRDGLFRPLRRVRQGDEVRVSTLAGDFTYRVTDVRVVEPDDLTVIAPTPTPTLTLITCYPFNFVGAAPQRFIVRAERVGPADPLQH